jgi:uncharacterized protein (DUF1330 family)
MPAYLHANVQILDMAKYDEYRQQVRATIDAHGGRFLVRGGASERLEGDAEIHRQVIIEFPDMAALKAWYHSDAYKPLIALRQSAAQGTLVAIEGVAP